MYDAIKTVTKTGQEEFHLNGNSISLNVLKFWQWSSSELVCNVMRGVLAEFIVASTIDALDKPREEWDAYDLATQKGLKIEVKSSAYLQSWVQSGLSEIKFAIQPTTAWDDVKGFTGTKKRQSDIYVFCVLSHKDKSTVDPLNLTQWDFYILETSVLNECKPTQQGISLSSLVKMNPTIVQYDGLKEAINKFEENHD